MQKGKIFNINIHKINFLSCSERFIQDVVAILENERGPLAKKDGSKSIHHDPIEGLQRVRFMELRRVLVKSIIAIIQVTSIDSNYKASPMIHYARISMI